MQVSLSLNFQCDEDWFFRGVVSRSGLESPEAYVSDLVHAHLLSHRDVRVCPNAACLLPCFPVPSFPDGRKSSDKPTWRVPGYCTRCGTKLEASE